MSCHAILKNLYEPNKNICFASYFADEDVYRRFVKHNYVPPFIYCHEPFFVLLFSVNLYLYICHLIKCNKQQEKYRVSRKKIVHRILNIWINNLNFYHFLQFTVGKPELITT